MEKELTRSDLSDWGVNAILRWCGSQGFTYDCAQAMVAEAEKDPSYYLTTSLWRLWEKVNQ